MSQGFSNASVGEGSQKKTIDDFENIGKVSIVIFNQKEFREFKMYWENPEPPKHDEFDSEEEMNKTILQHNKSKQTKRQKKNGPSKYGAPHMADPPRWLLLLVFAKKTTIFNRKS